MKTIRIVCYLLLMATSYACPVQEEVNALDPQSATRDAFMRHKEESGLLWRMTRHFYIHGFRLRIMNLDMGCWGGATQSEICYEITKTSTRHWETNPVACLIIIDRQLYSVALTLSFVVACYLIMRACEACAHYIFVLRPINNIVQRFSPTRFVGRLRNYRPTPMPSERAD